MLILLEKFFKRQRNGIVKSKTIFKSHLVREKYVNKWYFKSNIQENIKLIKFIKFSWLSHWLNAHCSLLQVAETHWEILSCCLRSKPSTFSANRTRFSCPHRSCSVIDEFDPPCRVSSKNHHRISCFSSKCFSNLHCIFIMKSPTFQVGLQEFIDVSARVDLELMRKVFQRGGKQFIWWIEQCYHREVHSFFLPSFFRHLVVHFHSHKRS